MTRDSLFKMFKDMFPYLAPDVKSYKANKELGGIDLTLKDGKVLNFSYTKQAGWQLRGF